ncbi:hypothetical protein [Nocardiopsis alborubida]|uniref:Uncharacterized protein n=1 Tax=Nocardiopsis alborubida TaxID=146802 RepID=A0A7X6RNQ1_9ACTN|nr:hypothetical protein [Nocardiopsis alborubida]NKY96773.1 hypothetical protein [Nocardiopsis alborubida]
MLTVTAIAAGLAAFVALIWLVITDPDRADAWVWGLAVVAMVGDLVAAVRTNPHRAPNPRLAGLVWLASAITGVLLNLLASGAGGVAVIGYVVATNVLLTLPDAAGLWPGQDDRELSAPQ